MSGDHNQYQKDKSYLDGMDRYKQVRELVKDPSLRVTEIAWKTGYNKGHVSRLRKESMRQALKTEQEPVSCSYCRNSHTLGAVYFDQNCAGCVKRMTAPQPRQWQGLTDEEILAELPVTTSRPATSFARAIEAKLKEKNHG